MSPPLCLEAGLVAVFTFPLRQGAAQLGALDLYRDAAGPLDDAAMTVAQTLADVAAAYLLNAQARADLEDSSHRSRERSLHDALTGLPNRTLLLERIDHALRRGTRSGSAAAVLFVDLDQFKLVNDTFGHRVGDDLLVAVAERLTRELRPGDTLARLSGDEFVVLCEDMAPGTEVEKIAIRIGAALSEPFILPGAELEINASIGIAFAGRADHIPEELLHNADAAMYQAKRKGGARHEIVDLGEQRLADQRASLRRDLRRSCGRGELELDYQPVVTAADGRVVGVEALLRWAHPTRGLLPPAMLIPLAENCGCIDEIGRWVLEQACRDRLGWCADNQILDLGIAVNVSTNQLMSADYAVSVEEVLLSTGTEPGMVTLEVTEGVFVQDSERALVVLGDLKRLGVRLALDDFGTGYSSLRYLDLFPVDVVKIDRSFVANLGRSKASHAIVSAVVGLAHQLDLVVVAEGVETDSQLREVTEIGCDACQGFYFARPMSADAIGTLLGVGGQGRTPLLPLLPLAS